MKLIFDTKISSPFGWSCNCSWEDRFNLANNYADIIAVQTMVEWSGSYDLITLAKKKTLKPILAKGIYKTDKEIEDILMLGADYVLVVGRIPANKYINKCMLEPTCLKEMEDYPKDVKVVWNARNLITGLPKKETFEEARSKWDGWLCQASMITKVNEINNKADAVMIGTHMNNIIDELNTMDV